MTEPAGTAEIAMDVRQIMALLPHRYPFLMVDRIEGIVAGEKATGIKNVSINEPFFQGHFPSAPIMPGVLLIEAMAQTAGALVVYTLGPAMHGKLVYFMSIADARFRHPVVPGDRVLIPVRKIHARGNVWKFQGECRVGDRTVADATYTAMIMDR